MLRKKTGQEWILPVGIVRGLEIALLGYSVLLQLTMKCGGHPAAHQQRFLKLAQKNMQLLVGQLLGSFEKSQINERLAVNADELPCRQFADPLFDRLSQDGMFARRPAYPRIFAVGKNIAYFRHFYQRFV